MPQKKSSTGKHIWLLFAWAGCFVMITLGFNFPVSNIPTFLFVSIIALIISPVVLMAVWVVGTSVFAFSMVSLSALKEAATNKKGLLALLLILCATYLASCPFSDKTDPYEFQRETQEMRYGGGR